MTVIAQNVSALAAKQTKKSSMFKRHNVSIMSNPVCENIASDLTRDDFRYYDKDGFELNKAEQKFYRANELPIIDCLNHLCWQEPWLELEKNHEDLILDHAMFLCRASYERAAAEQLESLKSEIPVADYLLRTKKKWGFDFALDAIQEGTAYEVLHVEYDSYDYETFKNRMIGFEWTVRHTDWRDAARRVWAQRDQWQHLKGFDQNHWKAEYLLGWRRAEYTEKTV